MSDRWSGSNVLVKVDATVGELAERSLPLELCKVNCQPKFHILSSRAMSIASAIVEADPRR